MFAITDSAIYLEIRFIVWYFCFRHKGVATNTVNIPPRQLHKINHIIHCNSGDTLFNDPNAAHA